jgi:transposase
LLDEDEMNGGPSGHAQKPVHGQCWGGMCPGNRESAGKHLGGKTRKGNPWLLRILGQSAWAAARKKNTYLSLHFRRQAAKRGRKRAIVAVGHGLLVSGITYKRTNASIKISVLTILTGSMPRG